MGTKKYVEGGFGHGESEYELSFGLAPRNPELLPSGSKTSEAFNFPFRARNPDRTSDSISPLNLRSVGHNWGPGACIIPKDKRTKVIFLTLEASNYIFFTCHLQYVQLFYAEI